MFIKWAQCFINCFFYFGQSSLRQHISQDFGSRSSFISLYQALHYMKKKFIDGSIISLLSLLPDNMTYWNLHIFNIFMYMSLFWVFIFRVTCLLWSLFCRFYFLCMSIFNFSSVFLWILFFEPIGLPHFMRVSTHFLKLFVGALLAGFCDLVTLFMSVNASWNWFAI